MKKTLKKCFAVALAAAMAIPMLPTTDAEAANVIVTYDFENGTGMTSTGYGTDPTVIQDAQMGNVLKFAEGGSSTYVTTDDDGSLGNNKDKSVENTRVDAGTPSSLKFDNPFCGKSLTGMTVSMWVKTTAAGATNAAGLVGWVSNDVTSEHPNKKDDDANIDGKWDHLEPSTGPYVIGITSSDCSDVINLKPVINMGGLFHNWYIYEDYNYTFSEKADTWVHMIVTFGDAVADTKIYLDGVDMGGEGSGGKRYNKAETAASPVGNDTEPTMTELLTASYMPNCYVGFTGFSPTAEGVCIDDLTFYDGAITDAEAMQMFTAAQASKANGGSGSASTNNSGNAADNNSTATDNNTTNNGNATGNVNNSTSTTNKNNTNKNNTTTNNTTSNLPQTGVASTSVMIGLGVAAVAGGAVLFKKKED